MTITKFTINKNYQEIQKQILEIFEGDRFALLEKSRKLGRILE